MNKILDLLKKAQLKSQTSKVNSPKLSNDILEEEKKGRAV
jgi:hypothetical protein